MFCSRNIPTEYPGCFSWGRRSSSVFSYLCCSRCFSQFQPVGWEGPFQCSSVRVAAKVRCCCAVPDGAECVHTLTATVCHGMDWFCLQGAWTKTHRAGTSGLTCTFESMAVWRKPALEEWAEVEWVVLCVSHLVRPGSEAAGLHKWNQGAWGLCESRPTPATGPEWLSHSGGVSWRQPTWRGDGREREQPAGWGGAFQDVGQRMERRGDELTQLCRRRRGELGQEAVEIQLLHCAWRQLTLW